MFVPEQPIKPFQDKAPIQQDGHTFAHYESFLHSQATKIDPATHWIISA
jgi:hypothetical protein